MPKTDSPPNPVSACTEAAELVDPAPARARFRVALQCPTPIPHPELEVEAADDGEAWQKFCAANGISDSEHPRTIVRI